MAVPERPKLYHILHADRLTSVVADDGLWCDEAMGQRAGTGTTIGIAEIKERRLRRPLNSWPDLSVGQCVPFYFCPRSVMLYLLHKGNHQDLPYRGGQRPVIHLEADLHSVVEWANANRRRWAFTLSNAGAVYCRDRNDLARLAEVNWAAVNARVWSGPGVSAEVREGKQAEFLVEQFLPWHLIDRVGVIATDIQSAVQATLQDAAHRPPVEVRRDWYY